MAGERRCWQRSKYFYRACHASRQVGRSRECNERCALERDVRRERAWLECGKSSKACMAHFLSNKSVTILFKAAKRWFGLFASKLALCDSAYIASHAIKQSYVGWIKRYILFHSKHGQRHGQTKKPKVLKSNSFLLHSQPSFL